MDAILNILTQLWEFLSRLIISAFPFLNAIFIIGAGCLGVLLHGKMRAEVRDITVKCIGIGVILFAVSELWNSFFVLRDGQVETEGTLLAVVSLLIGWLLGEALGLDVLLGKLGLLIHRLFEAREPEGKGKKPEPTDGEVALLTLKREDRATGFLIAATLCGFSSTVFTHFLEGRINDDPIPMLIKLAFDFALVLALASVYGSGVPFAGVIVLLNLGGWGLVYSLWGELFTPKLMGQLSLVGGAILLAGGICLCLGKRFRAANLIPALFIPIIYTAVMTKTEELVEKLLGEEKK